MVRKSKNNITKHKQKSKFRITRKLNKIGGIGTAERLAVTKKKAYGFFSKLDNLMDINKENNENINSTIQELKALYGIGQAEHVSPSYDIGQAEHVSPSYDIGQAEAEESEYVILDPIVKKKKNKIAVPFVIKPGSWDFYILKILDNEPKSENEISILMKEKFPLRMSGKTPDNTLNTRLQILVKEGYAERNEYRKGSRRIYKYFVSLDV